MPTYKFTAQVNHYFSICNEVEIEVEADSLSEAQDKALEQAEDDDYSIRDVCHDRTEVEDLSLVEDEDEEEEE